MLNSSARTAGRLAGDAYVLMERLPAVWAALADGELDWPRARVFIDVLGVAAEGVAEAVVGARCCRSAVGLSLGRLRARLAEEVLAVDEDARRAASRGGRAAGGGAAVSDRGRDESSCSPSMPTPVAAACWSTMDELAWMRKNDGDPRPIGLLRALTHAELMLRPWDTTRPAGDRGPGRDRPAARRCHRAGGAGAGAGAGGGERAADHRRARCGNCSPSWTRYAPAGCRRRPAALQIALTDADGALLATTSRRSWNGIARRGCPDHPDGRPRLRLPGAATARRRSTATAPAPAQRRFVRTRDRTCRIPAAASRSAWADLDHVVPHAAGGATDCDNLCCLCRRHHRLKTFAPGLAVRPDRRRRAAGDHPERDHPHHPTTGPARPHRATRLPHRLHRPRTRRPSDRRGACSGPTVVSLGDDGDRAALGTLYG